MTAHGVLCGCDSCFLDDDLEDDRLGKAIARAAEHDFISTCD